MAIEGFELTFVDSDRRHAVRNVYCIGRNYAEHARELGNEVPSSPVVFLKSTASLRGLDPVPMAHSDESFHHEAELVILVGAHVPLHGGAGWEVVSALGLGLDLTRREVQNQLKAKGLPWTEAKSFAGSGVLSPFVPKNRFTDPNHIEFSLSVAGTPRQSGDTRLMLNDVPQLLTHLASSQPLNAGDIVYTGTPAGVGPIRRGDSFVLEFGQLHLKFAGQL
ncbi:MAG: fumarylacetoacetate hydrolase family protein [Deltaproteobacteria bacterium]|nr:fumarylacetoacetate hydrolase family protein [Deltaproteobacteria bacterium]